MYWFSPSTSLSHSIHLSHSISLSLSFFSIALPIPHSLTFLLTSISLSLSAVTIGFEPDSYTAREDEGPITFTVTLLDGTLGRDVEVTFTTVDGSAVGEHLV